jgi:hypothetical protein
LNPHRHGWSDQKPESSKFQSASVVGGAVAGDRETLVRGGAVGWGWGGRVGRGGAVAAGRGAGGGVSFGGAGAAELPPPESWPRPDARGRVVAACRVADGDPAGGGADPPPGAAAAGAGAGASDVGATSGVEVGGTAVAASVVDVAGSWMVVVVAPAPTKVESDGWRWEARMASTTTAPARTMPRTWAGSDFHHGEGCIGSSFSGRPVSG